MLKREIYSLYLKETERRVGVCHLFAIHIIFKICKCTFTQQHMLNAKAFSISLGLFPLLMDPCFYQKLSKKYNLQDINWVRHKCERIMLGIKVSTIHVLAITARNGWHVRMLTGNGRKTLSPLTLTKCCEFPILTFQISFIYVFLYSRHAHIA